MTTTAVDELTCPTCEAGPFPTVKGYKAHLRSHETAVCPECGESMSALGLAAHRRYKHGRVSTTRLAIAGRARAARNRPLPPDAAREMAAERERALLRGLAAALASMLPGASLEVVERLTTFVAKYQPAPDLWAVLTATDGPWLCRTGQLGLVAAREHAAIVAVQVADVYRLVKDRP